jgi:transposase
MKKLQTAKKRKRTAAAEARYRRRSDAVAAVRSGETVEDVARIFGVGISTLFRWLARYRNGGEHSLLEGARAGRPRKVDERMMRWLYNVITLGNPLQYQFEVCLWTLAIIRSVIKRDKGIELSKSGVSRLMAHLGLTPQRPIFRSYQQDPEKIEKYLKETFPGARELASQKKAVIYFVDEASVRADAHRGTTWGKSGQTPVVDDSGDRFGVSMISAVSPRGDMKFRTFEGRMNEEKYLQFLAELLHDTGKPIIVIADNASYHSGRFTKKCAEESDGKVTLVYLPPYSPELNPDEQVWNHSKARLGKMFIESKERLVEEVRNVLRSIQMSTDLVLSFFRLKDTQYSAGSC